MPLHDAKDWRGGGMEAILREKKKINNSKTQQRSRVYKEGERATRPHSLTSYLIRLWPAFGAALFGARCTRHLCIDLSSIAKKREKRSKCVQMLCCFQLAARRDWSSSIWSGTTSSRTAKISNTCCSCSIAQHFQGFHNVLLYLSRLLILGNKNNNNQKKETNYDETLK